MANPNIVGVTSIYAKTATQIVGSSATAILANSSGSGKVYKINALYVSNVDASSNYNVTVDVYRSTVAYRICYNSTVPLGGTLDVISRTIYLEEGDSLRLTGSSANKLEAVCSYEDIS